MFGRDELKGWSDEKNAYHLKHARYGTLFLAEVFLLSLKGGHGEN
jgi:hypothetical protein